MIPSDGVSASEGGVMVVDDNLENLRLLEDMLRQKGYRVRSFTRGRLALASAAQSPPDLILLDVNMPEMTGYDVCEHIKSIEESPGIPVVFISALNQTEDKIRGFRAGGVDYISKPFQLEEVHARVEIHLKLRRAQQAEREILELTLNGAIRMLVELVHSNAPVLATRSAAIRDCAGWLTHRMGYSEPWQYELAAMVCLIGCVTLPEETFKRGYAGEIKLAEEEKMYRTHPASGANLLRNLPRLEAIAEMIRLQQTPDAYAPSAPLEIRQGAQILFHAIELDRRLYRGLSYRAALQEMKGLGAPFKRTLLSELDSYSPTPSDFSRTSLNIRQLFAGMVLDEEVVTKTTPMLILRKGTPLTGAWIERLENFAKSYGIAEPIPVLVPGKAGPPAFRRIPRQADANKLETRP